MKKIRLKKIRKLAQYHRAAVRRSWDCTPDVFGVHVLSAIA